jgi:hypothetical protein
MSYIAHFLKQYTFKVFILVKMTRQSDKGINFMEFTLGDWYYGFIILMLMLITKHLILLMTDAISFPAF